MGVVYSKQDAYVAWSGGETFLKRDQPWDSEAALVIERPDLFTDEPTKVAGRPPGWVPPVVERATRAPGETRQAPVKKAAKKATQDDD